MRQPSRRGVVGGTIAVAALGAGGLAAAGMAVQRSATARPNQSPALRGAAPQLMPRS